MKAPTTTLGTIVLMIVACSTDTTDGGGSGGATIQGSGGQARGGSASIQTGGASTGGAFTDAGAGGRLNPSGGEAGDPPLQLAIPLYIWPGEGTEWSQVFAAGSAVSYIIANAGDPGGPGPAADPEYTTAIASAHQAGQRVLGYVDTSYASRSLSTVRSEIDQWYSFYPLIDGIFFDLTPSSSEQIVDYYQPASNYVRAKPGAHIVIINPGQPDFDEAYMALADVAMSYENPYGSRSDGYAEGQYSAPAWTQQYDGNRFWHVILEVADSNRMRDVIALARARNLGNVYITNYPDPPAYARLPLYFSDEVAALTP